MAVSISVLVSVGEVRDLILSQPRNSVTDPPAGPHHGSDSRDFYWGSATVTASARIFSPTRCPSVAALAWLGASTSTS
jgi:hypothetical protein